MTSEAAETAFADDSLSADMRHPVLRLIEERSASGSQPGKRADEWSIGLVLEGGAMRGVVSAGMTVGLEQLGLLHTFDHVFGSSAGAINGAYFIAGEAALCAGSYYNEMTTAAFIDFRRAFTRKPIMSLEFVLDVVAEKTRPLDWDAVLHSAIGLHPIATDVDACDWFDFGADGFADKTELKEALRASSHFPVLAGPPLEFRGGRYLDASLRLSIPFAAALKIGCTHLLVLRTRPSGDSRNSPSRLERMFIARRLSRIDHRLADLYLHRHEDYASELEQLSILLNAGEPPYAYAITPAGKTVSSAERDKKKMLEAAEEGVRSVYRAFAGREPLVAEVLHAY